MLKIGESWFEYEAAHQSRTCACWPCEQCGEGVQHYTRKDDRPDDAVVLDVICTACGARSTVLIGLAAA